MADARRRIVVIDDDPGQLHLLRHVLLGAGYDVSSHLSSTEAVARLDEEPAVDLFVVDLHMPQIDGWKVCRLLRSPEFKRFNDVPILIVSGTFMGSDVEAITADIGADGFLSLPLKRDELLGHVADLLGGGHARAAPHVLIVEDTQGVARALSHTFREHGYEPHVAHSLVGARRLWGEIDPDVVVLDYHLPDGKGPELIPELRSPSDRTVVLVTTGDTDPRLPVRLLQLGADAYVRKPFATSFLVELAGKARRERSLLRVEAMLERRTRELHGSEARYRSLFEAIPDMVVTLDAADRIVAVNDETTRALRRPSQDLAGRHVSDIVAEDHVAAVAAALRAVRADGAARFEATLRGGEPPGLCVEVTAAAPQDAGAGSVLVVARDLTERRRAEDERRRLDEQLQQAQRLESLGVLAGGIAHDFNNLLVAVMGNASLALLEVDDGTPVQECLTQIETAARRAAELTEQILTFSGRGESAMAPQDVSTVVSGMRQLLEPALSKKARLVCRLADDLPPVEADAGQLRQVVMNVIMNASDALGESPGLIEVTTSTRELGVAEVRTHTLGERAPPGRYVAIEVTDDGCGMDEGTRRQIFDPFFSTKFAGRGLGLAATLGVVRAHAGLVSVESSPGRGTTVRVLLPALGARAAHGNGKASGRSGLGGAKGSVLVIEAEPRVRMLAVDALARAGYRVLEAADGETGLALLASQPGVELVVLDRVMPGRGGVDVLDTLRHYWPGLPVLLCSGGGAETLAPGTVARGVTGSLRKPYSPAELLAGIAGLAEAAETPHTAAAGGR